MPDNRLPTNQSQLDIVEKLDEIKDAIAQGGGGGGTGGHTIIDENGNSMTARAGLQFVGANVDDDATNNRTIVDVASASGIDGVFIDTENVIQTSTPITSSAEATYTATEDCIIIALLRSKANNEARIKIDDVSIFAQYLPDRATLYYTFSVKKGQVVKMSQSNDVDSGSYTVYGIQTGTTHSKFQPVIYSLEEREIGVWTDGKPLYEKTFTFSQVQSGANSWFNTGVDISSLNIESFGETILLGVGTNGYIFYPAISSISNNNTLQCMHFRNANANFTGVIVRYTKSTDTAGSGSWTPQGVPAVHYSTDEQVIGTYLGETLYQRSYDFSANPIDLSANSWTNTTASNSGIDKIINNEAMTSDGININWLGANARTGSYIQLLNIRNSTIGIAYLTIQYTKSS